MPIKEHVHVRINIHGSAAECPGNNCRLSYLHRSNESMHTSLIAYTCNRLSKVWFTETQPSISKIRVKDIGRLITVKGTVIRSGAIKLLEGERLYECNKCKFRYDSCFIVLYVISEFLIKQESTYMYMGLLNRFKVYPDLETGNSIQQPTYCPSQVNCQEIWPNK